MIELQLGNIIDVLPTFEADTFDGCLCDPPYELGFMGKHWDASGITYNVELWRQVYRALKPGAYLLAFGGTRTSHRLACAIEDAGFEIRDTIDWVYGSGFPKSLDVNKAIDKAAGAECKVVGRRTDGRYGYDFADNSGMVVNTRDCDKAQRRDDIGIITTPATDSARTFQGYGTALKPAHEPIIVARKPLSEATVAANCQKWGTGALNIDASRIEASPNDVIAIVEKHESFKSSRKDTFKDGWHRPFMDDASIIERQQERAINNLVQKGRFPANLITDGSAEVVAMFPQTQTHSTGKHAPSDYGKPAGVTYGFGGSDEPYTGDSGNASRFFKSCPIDDDDYPPLYYYAKASKAERDAGCEGMEEKPGTARQVASEWKVDARSPNGGYATAPQVQMRNHHPTVKPISLTRYLATLILPPAEYAPRKMLVPFAGVASEMIGAMLAGWDEVIGIEREAEYCEIGRARLEYWQAQLQLALPMVTA